MPGVHVVDEFTRESLADLVAYSIDADAVVTVLDKIVGWRGARPDFIRMDSGPELIAHALGTGAASPAPAPASYAVSGGNAALQEQLGMFRSAWLSCVGRHLGRKTRANDIHPVAPSACNGDCSTGRNLRMAGDDNAANQTDLLLRGILSILVANREEVDADSKSRQKTEVILASAGLDVRMIAEVMSKKIGAVRKAIQRAR